MIRIAALFLLFFSAMTASMAAEYSCEPRKEGTVKWFNQIKGYGFIGQDEGIDLFVHFSSIISKKFKSLTEGQRVEYCVEQGAKGQQAIEVVVLEEDTKKNEPRPSPSKPAPGKIGDCPSGRKTGTVKWFNRTKGYGFISQESGSDLFVSHISVLHRTPDFLYEDELVEFCQADRGKGFEAVDVVVLGD